MSRQQKTQHKLDVLFGRIPMPKPAPAARIDGLKWIDPLYTMGMAIDSQHQGWRYQGQPPHLVPISGMVSEPFTNPGQLPPEPPMTGQMWWNTSLDRLYLFDGNVWRPPSDAAMPELDDGVF